MTADERREQRRRLQRANETLKRSIMREAKSKPCADCEQEFPFYVMQFDHLGEKAFGLSVGDIRHVSIKKMLEEIEKCDVVCANCHAVRTYARSHDEFGLVGVAA